MRRGSIVVVASLIAACGGEPEPAPVVVRSVVLPAPDVDLALGVAGVPNDLLGPESEPRFGDVFDGLAADGFNRFVPVFLTSEAGEGPAFTTYFTPGEAYPEALFGPVPADITCEGPHNPWAAGNGSIQIVFPGYLLALDQPTDAPIDRAAVADRFEALLRDCLGGDANKLPLVYNYDEPANNYASSRCCDANEASTFELGNIATMSDIARDVLGADSLVVEAPLPYFLPNVMEPWGIPSSLVDSMLADFGEGVRATAPHADHYGYDVYPVDMSTDFSVITHHVEQAARDAPDSEPIFVLQGFGMADMGIDLGTPGRSPTRDETRAMTFLAASAGVRGIYWYGQSALTSSDPVWADLREVARDLRSLSGILLLPKATLPGDPPPASVTVDARVGDGVTWLLVIEREGLSVDVPLASSGVAVDALSGEVLDDEGALTLALPPYGSRMVAVFPN